MLGVFAFGCDLKADKGRKIGYLRVCLARGAGRAGGNLGVMASESCLTISSEERETWTAASLRGLAGFRAGWIRKRQADGHVSDNHSVWVG